MAAIAIIGAGQVGGALAIGLARAGHAVTLALRGEPSARAQAVLAAEPHIAAAGLAPAVAAATVVVLATPFAAHAEALGGLDLAGRILIDTTNPVGPGLRHGLDSARSGAEAVAAAAPGARVVKAFTIYGVENLRDSRYPGYGELLPTMLIAGDDTNAKTVVAGLCRDIGFEPVDTGPLAQSLHLEHLTLLWIGMARVQGQGADLVWARLRR